MQLQSVSAVEFFFFLPVLMHKVSTVVPMCTGVKECVFVFVREWLGWIYEFIRIYIYVLICVHLMAPHHSNIIYIKNNASYVYESI